MSSLRNAKAHWPPGREPTRLAAQMIQQPRKDPLGHAPDDGIGEPVGLDVTVLATNLEGGEVVPRRFEEIIQCNPLGCCNFRIETERGSFGKDKSERSNRDGRKDRITGDDVFQGAKASLREQFDADLFAGFSDDRGQQARILGLSAATRQRHVAGPGVAGAVGSAYEENGVGIGRDEDGHCSPDQAGIVSGGGRMVGQVLLELGEPAGQCE